MRMVFATCARCSEPTRAPDGLCRRCRLTPEAKRRERPKIQAARRR
jgi:hypothetical protein